MTQLPLESILSRFSTIQVEPISSQNLPLSKVPIRPGFYTKNLILKSIQQKFQTISNSLLFEESDQLVENHFTFLLNPFYQKTSKLPKKVFVCGYCKQPFFKPSQYLKHCFMEQCPINHERSTYFFHAKRPQRKIKNQDLKKMLSKKQLQILLKTNYSRDFCFFSMQESLIGDGTKNFEQSSAGKCSLCNQSIYRYKLKFKYHYLFECQSRNQQSSRKLFRYLYYEQPLERFIGDIENFHLNYNLLSTFENFYFKIQNNTNAKQDKKFYCQHCNLTFKDECSFLSHMTYQCKSKVMKQKGSSNHLKLKAKFQNKLANFQTVLEKQRHRKSNVVKNWEEKVNEKYQNLKEILENIYFCGHCLNIFQTSRLFIAHCQRYGCTFNHSYSTYQFYDPQTGQKLKIENIPIQAFQEQFRKCFYDKYLFETMNFSLLLQHNENIKNYHRYCGKCKKNITYRDVYIRHVLFSCYSQDNQNNSHKIQLFSYKLQQGEYAKIIMNHFYAMKIAEVSFGFKYVLSKNSKKNFDGDYVCGSCDTIFESQQEFVYHSIVVCQSLQNPLSSHFISKIYHPSVKIDDPLFGLIEESGKDQTISQKQRYKQYRILDIPNKKQSQNLNDFHQKQLIEVKKDRDLEIKNQQDLQEKQERSKRQRKIQEIQVKNYLTENQETMNYQQMEQIDIQNKNETEKVESNKKSHQMRRYLRLNLDCKMPPPKTKFYCGKCRLAFKKQETFIEHLEQICKDYQHRQSSHFYITNKRNRQILNQSTFGSLINPKYPFPKEYQIYQPRKGDEFLCICGKKDCVQRISYHRKYHWNEQFLNEKYLDYLDLRVMSFRSNIHYWIYIPSFLKIQSQEHQFVCPCKPWKKLKYEEFCKHLIKRHGGKTPKFFMRLPDYVV